MTVVSLATLATIVSCYASMQFDDIIKHSREQYRIAGS